MVVQTKMKNVQTVTRILHGTPQTGIQDPQCSTCYNCGSLVEPVTRDVSLTCGIERMQPPAGYLPASQASGVSKLSHLNRIDCLLLSILEMKMGIGMIGLERDWRGRSG